jgi:hypothetical protein
VCLVALPPVWVLLLLLLLLLLLFELQFSCSWLLAAGHMRTPLWRWPAEFPARWLCLVSALVCLVSALVC